ncbi:MAG TPA: hypothetical protein VFU11_08915 [Solirubrobacterales bacterium]|nr:hypothetical protein [Solirubrobacterales bacterium]
MGKKERRRAEEAKRQREREARARQREEEAAALVRSRRRRRRRTLTWLACIGILLVIGVIALTHTWTTRERVTGRLAGIHEVAFRPTVQSNGGVSPVCGCLKPHFNAWRGITFAGREVVLTRDGDSPLTEWTISGAEAKEGIEAVPAVQRTAVEVVQMRPEGSFDPAWMVRGELDEHGRVLSRSEFNAFMLSITTNGNLHVGMLGDVPVGAWIPLPGSNVELTADPSPFPGTMAVPRIVEKQPPGIAGTKVHFEHGRLRKQGFPIGDFLGPDVVLWSAAPFVEVSGSPVERDQKGTRLITAVRLKGSTFSNRISAVPLTWKEFFENLPYALADPHGGRESLYPGRFDGGRISVEVTKPLGARSYAQLRSRVLAHPVVKMRPFNRIGITYGEDTPRAEIVHQVVPIPEEDRYPPLPREAGFNVFGPLQSILFRGVRGQLLIADREKSLSGSADLRLTDVSGFRNEAGEEVVPAPLSTNADSASLQFRAVGEVRINGVSQTVTTFMEKWHSPIAALSFVFALLGTFFGGRAFLREIGEEKEAGRSGSQSAPGRR